MVIIARTSKTTKSPKIWLFIVLSTLDRFDGAADWFCISLDSWPVYATQP